MPGVRAREACPYEGGAPALSDLVGGQISVMIEDVSGTMRYVRGGNLRALERFLYEVFQRLDAPGVLTADDLKSHAADENSRSGH